MKGLMRRVWREWGGRTMTGGEGRRRWMGFLTTVFTEGLRAAEEAWAEAIAQGVHSADTLGPPA